MGRAYGHRGFDHHDFRLLFRTQCFDHGSHIAGRSQYVLQIGTAIFTGWGANADKNDFCGLVGGFVQRKGQPVGFDLAKSSGSPDS